MRYKIACTMVGLLLGDLAMAHSAYLLPNVFDSADREHVTVQGALTEVFFAPDKALKSDDYQVFGPNGAKQPITPAYFKDVALLEVATPAEGTYRISSGARVGKTSQGVLIDGQWKSLGKDEKPAANAQVYAMKSLGIAEVFVTRGKPTETVLAARNVGLEFHPLSHPNTVKTGSAIAFKVLFDGAPLANQAISLHHGAEHYETDNAESKLMTDAQGRFSTTLKQPGVYLVATRHRLVPKSTAEAVINHSYSLTFEVKP